MQLTLVRDETKKKEIIYVGKDKLVVSPFNPRRTREEKDIAALAQRIERNGFEITRALWVYPVNGHYEVFAGGNRLEAVKRTSIEQVPVVLHDGYTDDEITGLADEDNENDEYHKPVSVVDTWMDYKRLREIGWKQERIAKAKNVSTGTVSERLAYAKWPKQIIEIFNNGFLNERHAREINQISTVEDLLPWLDRESAMIELVKTAIEKHKKNVTAAHFKEAVDFINEVIKYVQSVTHNLKTVTLYDADSSSEWDTRAYLLAELARTNARTISAVKKVEHAINQRIASNLRAHQEYLEAQAAEAERVAIASQPLDVTTGDWWKLGKHLLYCGDTSQPEFYKKITNASFAFADPPYNAEVDTWDIDFKWNHDWLLQYAPIVAVTPGISSIKDFMTLTQMQYVWSMSCFIDNGMTRGAVGFGNWIYVALFATQSLHRNAQDIIKVSVSADGEKGRFAGFKGRKPPELISRLLELYVQRNQTVIDPFLGSGTTLFVAEEMNRVCIGGEISTDRCRSILEEWQDRTGIRPEKII